MSTNENLCINGSNSKKMRFNKNNISVMDGLVNAMSDLDIYLESVGTCSMENIK